MSREELMARTRTLVFDRPAEWEALVALLTHDRDAATQRLVKSITWEDSLRLQGEIKALDKMLSLKSQVKQLGAGQ